MIPATPMQLNTWIELEEEIIEKFGVNAGFFDLDGNRITNIVKWGNQLCQRIKATENGHQTICAIAHKNMASRAIKTKQTVIDECDGGLTKVVIPIFQKEKVEALFSCCGFFMESSEIEHFIIKKTTNLNDKEIDTLSTPIPRMPSDKIKEMVAYIDKKVGPALTRQGDQ